MSWQDLKTKGYIHLAGFLSAADVDQLRVDYTTSVARLGTNSPVVGVGPAGWEVIDRLIGRMDKATDAIAAHAGIDADICSGAVYFATRRAKFPWHQDHESFFLFQEHYHYLNFYIPFVKPVASHSNVCVIPCDALRASVSADFYKRLVGSGAHRFAPHADETGVIDDEDGTTFTMPVQLDAIAVTPELSSGDLLLLRGDMIHRTQDADTDRVAVSIRRQSSRSIVSKARMTSGGPLKKQAILRDSPILYQLALRCFNESGKEQLTAGELIAYIARRTRPRSTVMGT